MIKSKSEARTRRTRARIVSKHPRPRLSVFRSKRAIYAQVIDDAKGVTLAAASDLKAQGGSKGERAAQVGLEVAKKAIAKKVKKVVFDKGGYLYHGRVKVLADAARKGGLEF